MNTDPEESQLRDVAEDDPDAAQAVQNIHKGRADPARSALIENGMAVSSKR